MLAAVRGPASHWSVRATGSCEVDPKTGADRWLPEPDRPQAYLIERDPPEAVAKAIDDLMVQPPRHGRAGRTPQGSREPSATIYSRVDKGRDW